MVFTAVCGAVFTAVFAPGLGTGVEAGLGLLPAVSLAMAFSLVAVGLAAGLADAFFALDSSSR